MIPTPALRLLPLLFVVPLLAQTPPFAGFAPNNLVVSRTVYSAPATAVAIGQALPPVCPATAACGTAKATDTAAFPIEGSTNNVFNNNKVDGSFGITSPIFLDQLTPAGALISTLPIPGTALSTSFSSKSELSVNLSTDGKFLTFMGYNAPPNTVDVSNSNTPVVYDPTNPVGTSYFRSVAQVASDGTLKVTPTNAYSGNNGRAAILAGGLYYMVGNSNNGAGTPTNVITATGVQVATPGQDGATIPTMVGNFSIAQVNDPATGKPYAADKLGKDNNFRGLTIFNNTLYVTKGSGGNGLNTLYQVGSGGTLPTLTNAASTVLSVVPGFPTTLAKNADAQNPFGIWFASANTVYIADEGDGTAANAATSPNAGLQKWVLFAGTWKRVYVLRNGLNLGQKYGVTNYPVALNPVTDGLRNITGRVNADGTVTVWGVTSTVSANGDQGADPNKLVVINDILANTDPVVAAGEEFLTVKTAGYGEVLRGVSLTPGSTPVAPAALAITSSANPGAGASAAGSLATAYGANLAPAAVSRLPLPFLPTTIGGTTVTLTDTTGAVFSAALLAATPNQVNFVVPGVANGPAVVTVQTADGTKIKATAQVNTVAPALFTLNAANLAAATILSGPATGPAPSVYGMNSDGTIVAAPVNVSGGATLAVFATGLRAAGTTGVTATLNGKSIPVSYAGPQANYPGLDQVNIQLPASLAGTGNAALQVSAQGVLSNTVYLQIQ